MEGCAKRDGVGARIGWVSVSVFVCFRSFGEFFLLVSAYLGGKSILEGPRLKVFTLAFTTPVLFLSRQKIYQTTPCLSEQ